MKKKFLLFVCLSFSLLFLRKPLSYADVSFGKNKVIVDQHTWHIAETEHFQIHHYPEERHLIPKVSKMLEKAYEKVTSDLNISIEKKTPFFLYMTHNHFEQNNIASTGEGVGGFSEPYKNRFVIPITGSDKELEHVITHEFTHIAIFNIWYGGFWKSASLMRFVFYPLWIIEGLSEYESKEEWETYDHMLLRDVAISDMIIPLSKLHSFNHLKMHQISLGYQEGHSAISFLAEEYGEDKVPKLIKDLRESLDIDRIFARTIDTDLYSFDKKWQRYMKEKYQQEAEGKEEAEIYGKKLTENAEFNTNPVFSPNGKRIAFISSRNGYGDLFVMNVDGTSQKSVLKSRTGRSLDVIHYEGHALSWSPDGEKIIFAGEKKEKNYLYIINLRKNKLKKLYLPLEVLKSPCFSRKGDKIIFVGMEGGINDLYLVDANGKNMKKLTSDEFDDNYPVFSPDDRKIVYVSEREKQKDLFLLDVETLAITRLTSTPSDELEPSWSPDGESIIYIGDYGGIYNIYRMDLSDLGEDIQEENLELDIFQLTDVKVGVFTPEISPDGEHLLFVSYRHGEMNIHCGEFPQEEVFVKKFRESERRETAIAQLPVEPIGPIISPYPSPVSRIHPYRFKASTDLIFPMLFYSTTEGLYTAGYWQASDMLGNHGMTAYVEYASEYDWLTYQVGYIYQRWRPALGFFAYGKTRRESEGDDNNTVHTSEFAEEMMVSYPFDRFRRVNLGLITESKREWNGDNIRTRENGVALSLVRDTTQGKILDIMSGSRANFTVYQAFKALDGDLDYIKYILDARKYFKLSERNVLAFRFLGRLSQGKDREEPSLGGESKLRGLSKGYSSGSRLALINAEWRFMLFPEINWRFRLLWPEIYLKSLQFCLFTDSGAAWNEPEEIRTISDIKNTIGIGVRINTFLIQMFPFTLRLDYGWRTDKFTGKFYFSLGPTF